METAAEQRRLFIEAVRAGNAGKIELERGDRPQIAKRRLTEAGIRVRASWDDKSQRMLLWKQCREVASSPSQGRGEGKLRPTSVGRAFSGPQR